MPLGPLGRRFDPRGQVRKQYTKPRTLNNGGGYIKRTSSNGRASYIAFMSSLSIPISVSPRSQRTLELVGSGSETMLITKVSGELDIREETDPVALAGVQPHEATPPKADRKQRVPHRTYYPDHGEPKDIHETLVSAGIKVRDFAYPANRVGHTTPVHVQPLTAVQTPDESTSGSTQTGENLACAVEESPMPSVSLTWTEPHPCLRPIPKKKWPGEPKIPTPNEPYIPVYDTHRIPGWFDQALGFMEVEYRLSQDPRTVPISGMVSRRLLSLSPNLVDLSRYHEMDLEELRRYDRTITWRLKLGIEPYPWRAMHSPHWVPSLANFQRMRARGFPLRARDDLSDHRMHVSTIKMNADTLRCREEDDLKKCRLENLRQYQETGDLDPPNASIYDTFDRDCLTLRQRVTVFAKYKYGLQPDERYREHELMHEEIRLFDLEQKALASGADVHADVDVDMAVAPPALPPAPYHSPYWWASMPVLPLWGPNAPWTGYQLLSGTPTGKTVHEYAAELSKCTESERPWPCAPAPSKPREYAIHVGSLNFFKYWTAKGKLMAIDPGEDSDEEGGDAEVVEENLPPTRPCTPTSSESCTPKRKRPIEEVETEVVKGDVGENVDTPPPAKRVKV